MARVMRYRPYFAFGRSQLRIGVKWRVRVGRPGHECMFCYRYRWIGLTWQ